MPRDTVRACTSVKVSVCPPDRRTAATTRGLDLQCILVVAASHAFGLKDQVKLDKAGPSLSRAADRNRRHIKLARVTVAKIVQALQPGSSIVAVIAKGIPEEATSYAIYLAGVRVCLWYRAHEAASGMILPPAVDLARHVHARQTRALRCRCPGC